VAAKTESGLTEEQQLIVAGLIAANAVANKKMFDATLEQVGNVIGKVKDLWFSKPATRRNAGELRDIVRESQQQVAEQVEAMLDEVYDTMQIRVFPSKRNTHVKLPSKTTLRGIDALLEWERPARDARTLRLLGADELDAAIKAEYRAKRQAHDDLQLARREAERQRWGLSEDVIGYRRILRPEESEHGPCALCIVASTRVYGKSDLKPMHGGCVCDVLPVTKTADPGLTLNREDLDRVYDLAGGNDRESLIRVYGFDLNELKADDVDFTHGELGPILVNPRYKNRTKSETDDLAKKGLDPQKVYDAQVALYRKFSRQRAAGNLDVPEKTIAFHRETARKYAAKLGIVFDDAA
jgi:DNA-binding cell septation regulator SpoVG